MAIYKNENFVNNKTTQSGPYTFKNGLIQTDESTDATVGHILTTYYGCKKLTDAEVKALVKEQNTSEAAKAAAKAADEAKAAEAAAKKAAEEAAKKTAEEAAKKAAEVAKTQTDPAAKL